MAAQKVENILHLTNSFVPLVRPLTLADLQSCVALENEAFTNPDHRATPEKFEYRLTRCPELCLGLFAPIPERDASKLDIASVQPTETDHTDKYVLLAHIISTKIDAERYESITDEAMSIPSNWSDDMTAESSTGLGHQAHGRTVGIHSLAVAPSVQKCGLGKLIMKHYFDIMKGRNDVDYIQLIAQKHLIPFYTSLEMENMGPSKATFGGGGWYNMKSVS